LKAIASSHQDRLETIVRRAKQRSRQNPPLFYRGHDRTTGRSLVSSLGSRVQTAPTHTNRQPKLGQVGIGSVGMGFDVGSVRYPSEPPIEEPKDIYAWAFVSYKAGVYTVYYAGNAQAPKQISEWEGPEGLQVSVRLIFDKRSRWDITAAIYDESTYSTRIFWAREGQGRYWDTVAGFVGPLGAGEFNRCSNQIKMELRLIQAQYGYIVNIGQGVQQAFAWRPHVRRALVVDELPVPDDPVEIIIEVEPPFSSEDDPSGAIALISEVVPGPNYQVGPPNPPDPPITILVPRSGFVTTFEALLSLSFARFNDDGSLVVNEGSIQFEGEFTAQEFFDKASAEQSAQVNFGVDRFVFTSAIIEQPYDHQTTLVDASPTKPCDDDTASPGAIAGNYAEFRSAAQKLINLSHDRTEHLSVIEGGLSGDADQVGDDNLAFYLESSTEYRHGTDVLPIDGALNPDNFSRIRSLPVAFFDPDVDTHPTLYTYITVDPDEDHFTEWAIALDTLELTEREVRLPRYSDRLDRLSDEQYGTFVVQSDLVVNAQRVRDF